MNRTRKHYIRLFNGLIHRHPLQLRTSLMLTPLWKQRLQHQRQVPHPLKERCTITIVVVPLCPKNLHHPINPINTIIPIYSSINPGIMIRDHNRWTPQHPPIQKIFFASYFHPTMKVFWIMHFYKMIIIL